LARSRNSPESQFHDTSNGPRDASACRSIAVGGFGEALEEDKNDRDCDQQAGDENLPQALRNSKIILTLIDSHTWVAKAFISSSGIRVPLVPGASIEAPGHAAWFDGTLVRNHAAPAAFQYTNNEQSRVLQFGHS
jgi:hypothetical protein